MHITLWYTIKPGQLYFVAFPKWPGTFDPEKENPWHATSVEELGTNGNISDTVTGIALGSMALVLKPAGVGVEEAARGYNKPPQRYVRCLVTLADSGRSFVAIVGVSELWSEDPRRDPVPASPVGMTGGAPYVP